MQTHELEAVAAILELGHGVEANDLSAFAHGRRVIQLLVEAIDQFEVIAFADFVRGNADDLSAAAREVDQSLVADDDLHGIDPAFGATGILALGVERHQVGVTENGIRLQAHLRALADSADQAGHIALGERRRCGGRDLRDLQQALDTERLGQHFGQLALLLVQEIGDLLLGLHVGDANRIGFLKVLQRGRRGCGGGCVHSGYVLSISRGNCRGPSARSTSGCTGCWMDSGGTGQS